MTSLAKRGYGWIDAVVFELARELRWSFLPPLMVYFAYGFTGLTQIVGTFFVKDYLDLSAAFLAGLTFWAGLPWALKMPLGHLVDIIWRWKWLLVWIGAGLLALSVLIMYFVIAHRPMMEAVMPISAWYITSYLLAPSAWSCRTRSPTRCRSRRCRASTPRATRCRRSRPGRCTSPCRRWAASR